MLDCGDLTVVLATHEEDLERDGGRPNDAKAELGTRVSEGVA
jgi:hypothetical protein